MKQDMNRGTGIHEYFKKLNRTSAYWAGYIAADGNIYTSNNRTVLQIDIKIADKEHLEVFRRNIKCNSKVRIYKRTTTYSRGIEKEYAHIGICNASEIAKTLLKVYNITERKSKTLKPPQNLDLIIKLAFIKGIIDGDGTIRINDKVKTGRPRLTLEICGTKDMLTWISTTFNDIIKDDISHVYFDKASNTYRYILTGLKAKQVLLKLHKIKTPELKRKWEVLK